MTEILDTPESAQSVDSSRLPCCVPCPKCGSSDIHRKYINLGDLIFEAIGERKHEDEYSSREGTGLIGKCEHIHNTCRCCQFGWNMDVMAHNASSQPIEGRQP